MQKIKRDYMGLIFLYPKILHVVTNEFHIYPQNY